MIFTSLVYSPSSMYCRKDKNGIQSADIYLPYFVSFSHHLQLPAGAVSLFGDAPNPLAGKLSPTKTPSDEDEEEPKRTPPVAKKPAGAKASTGGGLFAEGDDDGDLFASDR